MSMEQFMSRESMPEKICRAQAEIERKKDIVKKGKMRQYYHFMAQTGWLNDPNGLVFFRGKYHWFFQCNPYYGLWDYMHWGHAVSEDMVHWEYLPLALAPSETYDDYIRGGCFSGSAIEHEGKLYLIFTGTTNNENGCEQTQCVAWSEDGISFEKYENNPVLTAPEWVNPSLFRDPKVWKHGDRFYMVCGAGSRDGRGQALLYCSDDLLHWDFVNVLAESRGEWGIMWECPDFYLLGDAYVLTISPIKAGEHTAVYFTGDFDYDTGKFAWQVSGEMDWGLDYYAPQSFVAEDGRRIVVSWANEWEWMPYFKDWGPTYLEGWCGFFNLPREVRLLEDRTLQFVPIRELETIRTGGGRTDGFTVREKELELRAGDGISFEMKMEIDLEETDADELEIFLRCGGGRKTVCTFDLKRAELRVDRNASDGWSRGISRSVLFLKGKRTLDIHIFSDQSSVEIFADGYRNNHAVNVFAGNEQNQIRIRAQGGKAIVKKFESYGMKECYVN